MTRRSLALLAAVVALSAVPAFADVIELTDGRKVNGSIKYQGNNVILTDADGGATIQTTRDKIKSVTLTSSVTPDQAASAEWARISIQIRSADDLGAIMKMHEDFLAKYPKAAMAKDVIDSLTVYQQLSKNDPVKFRGRWMPRAQVEVTVKKWTEDARPALELYRAGKMKETLDAVKPILVADDQNPDALTLGGLAAFRNNALPQAKTYFTSLAAADPTSVLAENNLGVVCYQQKAQAEGLLHYGKALQIKPENRLLLDNIAEALNGYTGDRNGTPYKSLLRQYEQAEARLETTMAKLDLHRWGSGWVTQKQFEQLTQRQKTLQDQMAQLEVQHKAAAQQYAGLDAQILKAQEDVQIQTANVQIFNSEIITAQAHGLDPVILMASRDLAAQEANRAAMQVQALQATKTQLQATLQATEMQAQQVKAQMNNSQVPQFTGVQRIMEMGEGDKPPAPVPVAITGEDPAPLAPVVITPTPEIPPVPVVTPVPVPVQVYVSPGGNAPFIPVGGNPGNIPANPNGGNGGNGGNGRGNNPPPKPTPRPGGPSGNSGSGAPGPTGGTASGGPGGMPIPVHQPQPVPTSQPSTIPRSQ